MGSKFHVRTINMANGERRAMLCERTTGIPLENPTYYITSCIYLAGQEYNTQINVLSAIHFLYAWGEKNRIDFERSFKKGEFLNLQQIESLAKDVRVNLSSYLNDSFELNFEGDKETKSAQANYRRYKPRRKFKMSIFNNDSTTGIRLAYIRRYLDWLANETISRTSARRPEYVALQKAKEEMVNAIEQRTPSKSYSDARKGLTVEERNRFLQVVDPKHPENPFKSDFSKIRNQLICLFLLFLGARRGEILLIKEKDIDWNTGSNEGPTIGLRDHPFDPEDPRRVRPQFKTLERKVPLNRNLARLLKNFIQRFRNRTALARNHGYIIIGRDGNPLSLSSVDDIFSRLTLLEGLPRDLSPHKLRYTWNDVFSEIADIKITAGEWQEGDEKLARRYHQGWSLDSKMPDKYAARHIEKKAAEISLKMQSDLMGEPLFLKD